MYICALYGCTGLSVLSSFATILLREKERAGCFTFIVLSMSRDCYCSESRTHGVVVWSAVCDCDLLSKH